MNYHGYLIARGADYPPRTFLERVFDPWEGPLSTRFAATFVIVAGMGITLLTRRSRASGDRAAISADRWKLTRRGVLLFVFGYFFDWVWSGTILFYYGAFFMVGVLLFTLRSRWLVVIGVTRPSWRRRCSVGRCITTQAGCLYGSSGVTRSPRGSGPRYLRTRHAPTTAVAAVPVRGHRARPPSALHRAAPHATDRRRHRVRRARLPRAIASPVATATCARPRRSTAGCSTA